MTPREEVEDAVTAVDSAVTVSTVSNRVRPVLSTQVSTVWQRRQNAVCVRRACKRYGSKSNPQVVLDQLHMTVPKGTIYGLLGASGCGKTTLLTCIVGRRRLNTGEIWVLGGKPGSPGSGVPGPRVGYMPQEIALYGEFSIRETMIYFGWIYGLTIERIEERLKFLLKFLELPTSNRLVKNLSGGQQRRVSFAAALVHDPELLILDEPTVGVDPVLRQSIWEHLVAITKDGNKTVIITTHYIEEARQAHAIGLMRGGRLLAEQSPDALLATFGCSTLEDVFLKLSREQNDRQAQQRDDEAIVAAHRIPIVDGSGPLDVGIDSTQAPKSTDPKAEEDFVYESEDQRNGRHWSQTFKTTCSSRYKALLWKNFMWMWRNPGIMLFIIGLPMVQVVLFCVAVGHDPAGLKLAVVNHDSAPGPLCPILTGCNLTHLSCRYLGHLGEYPVVQEPYGDVESAKDAVRLGHAWGAIYFTENYTDALVARGVLGKDADNETLDQSEMRVWLDLSNKHIGLMLQRYMHQSYESFLKDLLTACQEKPQFVQTPVKFLKPVYGPAIPNFTDFAAPGVMLTIVFFLAVALMSGAMIIERLEGLMERSLVAGITPTEMLMSHVICQFLVMSGQSAVVIIFSLVVFNITCEGPVIFVIAILMLQGMCGMCFGMLISCLCENERNATYLGLGSFLPIVMLCGIIWPVEGMNTVLRVMSSFLPLTYPTESLRSILARGWSIDEPVVYHGFICIAIWIVVFLSASVLIIKFKKG